MKLENDVDIIAIVKTRLNGMNGCCAVAKSLQMLDDGLDLMDKKEVEALKRMKKDLSEVEAKSTEFKEAFKKKAKDVLPGPARAKKKTSKTPNFAPARWRHLTTSGNNIVASRMHNLARPDSRRVDGTPGGTTAMLLHVERPWR